MRISVIIATRNRAHAIKECLDSVMSALVNAECLESEIIVVDNGSTDGTSSLVQSWGENCSISVRVIQESRAGLSFARNAGVKSATGSLVVFTDDDCRMSPSYVKEALYYDTNDNEPVFRSGSVVLGDPSDLPLTIKSVNETKAWKKPMSIEQEGGLLSSLIGCNMAIRLCELKALGPFDTRLGAGTTCPAGEDTDYFYRAYLAGMRLEIVPDMIVSHHHGRKTYEDKTRLLRNYSIGNAALAAKYLWRYPNFSRHIYWELKATLPRILEPYKGMQIAGQISPRDRLLCMLLGVIRFCIACATKGNDKQFSK